MDFICMLIILNLININKIHRIVLKDQSRPHNKSRNNTIVANIVLWFKKIFQIKLHALCYLNKVPLIPKRLNLTFSLTLIHQHYSFENILFIL